MTLLSPRHRDAAGAPASPQPSTRSSSGAGSPDRLRRVLAATGLCAIVVAELVPTGSLQGFLAGVGFFALLVAAVMVAASSRPVLTESSERIAGAGRLLAWRWTLVGLGVFGGLVVQTWFRGGTLIASGDIAPPIGTAWIGRLFATYGWSGNDLGGAQANQGMLPFAVLDSLVHKAGGSGALAQRIWITLLVAGILVAAGALARSFGLTPTAGAVVALLFFFNPITLSQVGINDVYLAAMVLLAALPAAVVSHGRGNLRTWQLALVFVASAPFVGFAYSNPPLVAMIVFVTAVCPLLVRIRFGPRAAGRSLRGLWIGLALGAGASAYWFIPSQAALVDVATGNLSTLSSWAFTEARSNLANGFWLNTTWGWQFPEYFPYAHFFARFPLIAVRALVPFLAFVGLAMPSPANERGRAAQRLGGALAVGALAVILLSTGTNAPGNLLFDPLYHLPHGWLLREPGRFLIAVALFFALLVGLLIDRLADRRAGRDATDRAFSRLGGPRSRFPLGATTACLAAVVGFAAAFPLWTGGVVLGAQHGFPSAHVTVPGYWTAAADYLNSSSAPSGALLVLPPDDFYQMPYAWYYGNDGFIPDLFDRHVVVPAGQGYDAASSELVAAVGWEAQALVNRRWTLAGDDLDAIGTPIVMVRGDVDASFPKRNIVSPAALLRSLDADPEMQRIHSDGPLSFFGLRTGFDRPPTTYATTTEAAPDLRALAVLPGRTALVTSPSRPGHVLVAYPPPAPDWTVRSNSLTTEVQVPEGWDYTVRSIAVTRSPESADLSVRTSAASGNRMNVQLSEPLGTSLLANGDFHDGPLSPVGNCDNALPVTSGDAFGASVLDQGGPNHQAALQLEASIDSACESAPLGWRRGSIDLRLETRSVAGSAPRLCLWEAPLDQCATTPPLSSKSGWQTANMIVTPDAGTKTVRLFLYSDAPSGGGTSIEQYADVRVRSTAPAPQVAVVGTPTTRVATADRLVAWTEGYSSAWTSPSGTTHVVVDGLRNGWIVSSAARSPVVTTYLPTLGEQRTEWLFGLVMVALAAGMWCIEVRRRRLSPPPPR